MEFRQKIDVCPSVFLRLNGSARHSEWNNFDHHFAFRGGRPLEISRKLKFSYGGSADVSTFQNFLFEPTRVATVAGTPMDFNDLSAAMLQHSGTNNQLAAALTGSPVADPSLANLLYGNQVLTIGAQANLTYAKSPRLSYMLMFSLMRLQPLSFGGGNSPSATSGNSMNSTSNLPLYTQNVGQDSSAGAGLGISYLISPRITFGMMGMSNRTLSRLADQYVTTAAATLTSALSRHWFRDSQSGEWGLVPAAQHFFEERWRCRLAGRGRGRHLIPEAYFHSDGQPGYRGLLGLGI